MDQVKPKIFFILGGTVFSFHNKQDLELEKGTQSANMVEKYHFVHLSVGDLLSEERSKNTQNADLIEEYIKSGKLLQVIQLLNYYNQPFQLIDQIKYFQLMDSLEIKKIFIFGLNQWVIRWNLKSFYFECDEQTLKNRIQIRAQQSGRSDDNDETLIKRLKTDNESTRPIIQYFDFLSQCIHIKADKTVDEVFQEILMKLDEIL